eukprot:15475207-Alexandrium_andersonii.AAC.1
MLRMLVHRPVPAGAIRQPVPTQCCWRYPFPKAVRSLFPCRTLWCSEQRLLRLIRQNCEPAGEQKRMTMCS